MHVKPTTTSDATTAGVQQDPALLNAMKARRKAASTADGNVPRAINQPATNPAAMAADPDHDIDNGNEADAVMASLRGGLLGQPQAAMLGQANLSAQSVYDLIQ